ncbi:MAG TPA: GNAT family protein [Candidatus Limnocylindria bacterium]|nr:GNAT family protein [Candidatus Limnocylindria bacterium]
MTTPPILRDIPDSFSSDRLLIRSPRPGDGPALQEAIEESIAELRPWMPWASEHETVDVSEAYARRSHSEFLARANLPLFLFRRDDGRFVGGSGLHRIDWEIPRFEIGYWVRTSLTGQGYATEAALRIAEFAFDELAAERVEIWCDARNERSAAVARRAGFELEATMRRNRRNTDGELADSLGFARLR